MTTLHGEEDVDCLKNVGLDETTHFWCGVCKAIQPTYFEGANNKNTTGEFIGGDIVCRECSFIIATAYTSNTKEKK